MAKKKTEVVEENIRKYSLEDIMADRFSRYSKYIIQERALPDARDGLKPVQRRILYAMHEAGNTWNKPYHKSAKTVGNVIGNYHPHGDSSVYDAMVRLSQDWKITTPLVDMQGNNGSIDDDPAAAMRYTEARLAKISDYLLQDIEKDTVEWAPNFSDEKMEPTVLPARYPNLLVNGITGIAAGYATNIPPHNLNEVIKACIYRIDHPQCTLDDLMHIVKGPDFPTGGTVMGMDGIRQAFESGKGRVMVRSKVHVEQTKTIKQLIITEIPYEVVKSNLVKRIDEIRLNKKIDGILDVRDESDRTGLRIVVDIKKESPEQYILNYLYKNTDLQVSYNYNMIAIVNKTPVQMGLQQAIDAFLAHREDVVLRRSKHDLKTKKERAHILEGLIYAVSVMDEIIQIIRASKDKKDAKKNLISRFDFTDMQAEAIVVMRLYRLTNTDVKELKAEFNGLKKEIKYLKGIIENQAARNELLISELEEVNAEFNTPRRSIIQNEIEELVIDEMAMISHEQVMLTLTRDGYVKRVSMRSYNASNEVLSGHKDSDVLIGQSEVNTRQILIFFTNRGKYGYIPVYQIEEAKWKDLGSHLSNYVKMDDNEKIIDAFVIDQFDEAIHIITMTRSGFIKRTKLKDFEVSRTSKTIVCMKVGDLDEMVRVQASLNEDDRVCIVSKNGFGLAYAAAQIPLTSLKAKGVKGMNVENGDGIADFFIADLTNQCILVTEDGSMKRIRLSDVAELKRPAKGVRLAKLVKSRPFSIEKAIYVQDLHTKYTIMSEDQIEFEAKDISLMALTATYSAPFGKLEQKEWNDSFACLHQGNWKVEEKETYEQVSLFEDGNE